MILLKVDARLDGEVLEAEQKGTRHPVKTRYINLNHVEMIYEDDVLVYNEGSVVKKDGKDVYETVTRIRLTHARKAHAAVRPDGVAYEGISHDLEYEVLQPMSDVIDAINEALPDMCVCDTTEDKPEKPDTPEKE